MPQKKLDQKAYKAFPINLSNKQSNSFKDYIENRLNRRPDKREKKTGMFLALGNERDYLDEFLSYDLPTDSNPEKIFQQFMTQCNDVINN